MEMIPYMLSALYSELKKFSNFTTIQIEIKQRIFYLKKYFQI